MYGKVFEDLFCSTLMDFGGDTAYVFIAMIVLSDEDGIIKHTASSLARVICKKPEDVERAIVNLEKPDRLSNIKSHDGRRIVPLHELMDDETRGWLVVNKAHYRDRKDPEEVRKQNRERQQRFRDRKAVTQGNGASRDVTQDNEKSRYTDTDTDTKKNTPSLPGGFVRFWTAWPSSSRKGGKAGCADLWRKGKIEDVADQVVAHVEAMKRSEDWTKESGRYIPAPAVYLRQKRWDGAEDARPSGEVI